MSREYDETVQSQIRDVIARLQSPVQDLSTLLALLAAPLDALGILPPQFLRYNISPLPANAISAPRHVPLLQRALLEHVVPAWGPILDEKKAYELAQQYFAPDVFLIQVPAAKHVALHAYATILSLPLTDHSLRLLHILTRTYPIDILWSATVSGHNKRGSADKGSVTWEDCVRNISSIPGKVANAFGGKNVTIPTDLESGPFFNNVSKRTEILISSLPARPSQDELSSIVYLITKLVNVGVFPTTVPSWPSQPSFFQTVLSTMRVKARSSTEYASIWRQIFGAFPSTFTLQSLLVSLFGHLTNVDDLDSSPHARAIVKREAQLLTNLLGRFTKNSDILDGFTATALGRTWSICHARIFVTWIAGADRSEINLEGLELLLNRVVDVWTAPDHVKHSLLSGHQYFTALLLLTVSHFPDNAAPLNALAFSPPFVKSISTYISHLDHSVRRCGMLVAEEVARATNKKLDFGDWDGDTDGKKWCRQLRELMKSRDAEAVEELAESDVEEDTLDAVPEITDEPIIELVSPAAVKSSPAPRKPAIETINSGYDSDDSLTGYVSEPSSSRSPSPTPSELEEIEKDPTLRVTQTKVSRPVYLAQLGEMVRPTGKADDKKEEEEPERIRVALDVGEELIRRKRAYGTELEENAVNLVFGFVGLNNNFDLEGFEEKRQAIVAALVACCPRKAAPAIIQEFFRNQYSTEHRFVMLNALALGARELASLPLPPNASKVQPQRIAFPSKRLPPALHEKYTTTGNQLGSANPVQHLLDGISQKAIESGKVAAQDKVPEYARERQLRLKRPAKVSEVTSSSVETQLQSMQLKPQPVVAFTEVAAECFICPMINHFWTFLRDEQTREERTAHQEALHRYRGAGTGLILNAFVLSHFMATLAVLVHAAHNAKEWLAVIAPDALELAITVGTRPVSREEGLDHEDSDDEGNPTDRQAKKEAALLTTCLELAVVVLDGCLESDGGKSLGLEHTALLLAAGEWGSEVLSRLEKGTKVLGGGGIQEMKLRRAAAGVVLKVDELSSRWRQSMVNMGF